MALFCSSGKLVNPFDRLAWAFFCLEPSGFRETLCDAESCLKTVQYRSMPMNKVRDTSLCDRGPKCPKLDPNHKNSIAMPHEMQIETLQAFLFIYMFRPSVSLYNPTVFVDLCNLQVVRKIS